MLDGDEEVVVELGGVEAGEREGGKDIAEEEVEVGGEVENRFVVGSVGGWVGEQAGELGLVVEVFPKEGGEDFLAWGQKGVEVEDRFSVGFGDVMVALGFDEGEPVVMGAREAVEGEGVVDPVVEDGEEGGVEVAVCGLEAVGVGEGDENGERGDDREGVDEGAVVLQLVPLRDADREAVEDVVGPEHLQLSAHALRKGAAGVLDRVGRVVAVVVAATLGPRKRGPARHGVRGGVVDGKLVDEDPEGSNQDAGDLEGVGQLEGLFRADLDEFCVGWRNEPLGDGIDLGGVNFLSRMREVWELTTTCGTSSEMATWATVHIRTAEFKRRSLPLMALSTRMIATRCRIGQ